MRAEGRYDNGRMCHDAGHFVIDLTTEVDKPHGSLLAGCRGARASIVTPNAKRDHACR